MMYQIENKGKKNFNDLHDIDAYDGYSTFQGYDSTSNNVSDLTKNITNNNIVLVPI